MYIKKMLGMLIGTLCFYQILAGAHASLGIETGISYILVEANTGMVLLEQNADVKVRPASTTKIMTALVALERGDLNAEMKISKNAVFDIGPGGMNIGLMEGEESLTLDHMLHVMLIRSANETANIIAENLGESYEHFIDLMNKKALELGAKDTFFVNPNGKDNLAKENAQLTTARDMAQLTRFAMRIPTFRQIVEKISYADLPSTNKHNDWPILQSTNRLLWDVNRYPYRLDGQTRHYVVNGVKTGYTSKAQGNLIASAVDENGTELIAVIMNVPSVRNTFDYAKRLFAYGFENFTSQTVVSHDQAIKKWTFQLDKREQTVELVAKNELTGFLPVNPEAWNIDFTEYIPSTILDSINHGDILGYLIYHREGVPIGTVHLAANATWSATDEKPMESKPFYSTQYFWILLGTGALAFFVAFKKRFALKKSLKRKDLD
jgi:serine-type D-Ala-D-Ala carboxypeptidase (penicillin-binding protein 5/6)